MTKLPAMGMDACVAEKASLDGYGMVRFDRNFYSIPDQVKAAQLWVKAYWNKVEITDGSKVVASHSRCYRRQERIFEPEHYFDLLEKRPGAVRFARPILSHPWPTKYWDLYGQMVEEQGASCAGKEFIRILRLHNQYGENATLTALAKAHEIGVVTADIIHSLLLTNTRTTEAVAPLDLSNYPHLTDCEVMAIDLAQYHRLLEDETNEQECVA